MDNIDAFRHRYAQLQKNRPAITASGIWFSIMHVLAQLLVVVFALVLGLLICIAFGLYPDAIKESLLVESLAARQLAALGCILVMLFAGYAARMAQRVVLRNNYIVALEKIIEETVLFPQQPPQQPPQQH